MKMNAIKLGYTDAELLTYGINSGFVLNEFTSLFERYPQVDISLIQQKLLSNMKQKAMLDYLTASFMNPGAALKVIGINKAEIFGFRAALPFRYTEQTPYAILLSAGDRGLMMEESSEYVEQVLFQLSGYHYGTEETLGFSMPPVDVLVFLAVCDAIQQTGPPECWFTGKSVMNAFNTDYDNTDHLVCAALAAVAGDVISRFFTPQKVSGIISKMVENQLLMSRETQSGLLYSLSPNYHRIPILFENAQNKLAMLRYHSDGQTEIILMVSDQRETWAFLLNDGEGRIERVNDLRQKKILTG
jgi:hypothetical protein